MPPAARHRFAAGAMRRLRRIATGLPLVALVTLYFAPTATCQQCRLDQGSWVYDPSYRPSYNGFTCNSIRSYYNCDRNGRKDSWYKRYVWRSPHCDLRRFSAPAFLRVMRHRVFLFVGDSFASNLEASLRCLVETGAQTRNYLGNFARTGVLTGGFLVPSHNITFLRMPSNFLVKSKPVGEANSAAAWRVHLDRVDTQWAKLLPYTHYVLFSSGHWFINAPANLRLYYSKNRPLPPLNSMDALYKAHIAVRRYLLRSNYSGLPMVMTFSAYHYNNAFRAGDSAKSCLDTRGAMNTSRLQWAERNTYILEARDQQVRPFVSYPQFKIVDIARMSLARPDAHQGVYTGQKGGNADCSHWCVPGVPDTWSNMVYSYMIGTLL
eukprot:TRINITY_DN19046_c0_g1_i1.p1 TRINITY_DN19046_c0_g1~~TRINITY_DN19046_c0_g1_i1.p1  ORF type:complete len:379 (-),score=-31.10 TRINITY_DN19046_c0_g1_i1:76-1212(-)